MIIPEELLQAAVAAMHWSKKGCGLPCTPSHKVLQRQECPLLLLKRFCYRKVPILQQHSRPQLKSFLCIDKMDSKEHSGMQDLAMRLVSLDLVTPQQLQNVRPGSTGT